MSDCREQHRSLLCYEICLLLLCAAVLLTLGMEQMILTVRPPALPEPILEQAQVRSLQIAPEAVLAVREWAEQENLDWITVLAVCYGRNKRNLTDFTVDDLPGRQEYLADYNYYQTYQNAQFSLLCDLFSALYGDLQYFPVARSGHQNTPWINYVDSWGFERTYGGSRSHEGTDLMGDLNEPDYYPVVSMTDGVVEQIGWLEKGGWRIGIRSRNGGYFYYAHLSRYDSDMKKGVSVKAGQLLGFMGNTGYSKVEGTSGNFDVHLHMGIYISDSTGKEISFNPYWIMKLTENRTITADY